MPVTFDGWDGVHVMGLELAWTSVLWSNSTIGSNCQMLWLSVCQYELGAH